MSIKISLGSLLMILGMRRQAKARNVSKRSDGSLPQSSYVPDGLYIRKVKKGRTVAMKQDVAPYDAEAGGAIVLNCADAKREDWSSDAVSKRPARESRMYFIAHSISDPHSKRVLVLLSSLLQRIFESNGTLALDSRKSVTKTKLFTLTFHNLHID